MPRLPIPGSDDGTWGNLLNEFLEVEHNANGSHNVTLGGDLSGLTTNAQIVAGAVGSTELATDAVTDIKVSSSAAIAQSKIANLTTDLSNKANTTHTHVISDVTSLQIALDNKVDDSEKGAVSGIATLDGTAKIPVAQLPNAPITKPLMYSYTGTLALAVGAFRLYNDTGTAWTIVGVRASAGTAPTGASLIIDINIDGLTIFTTQANRPTIVASANTSGNVINMNITSIANGQYLTVDIDQIGSTVAGSDLTVQVEVI